MANIEEKVESLIVKPITELGYELYDIQYAKEGSDYYLKVFIENAEGISLEDCEKVTHAINDILDTANYIKEQYFLEVSSTGVEKVLRKDKHLQENIGEEIVVKLFKPVNNTKEIIAILQSFNEQTITIKTQNEEIEIEKKNIALIKKYYDWDNLGGNE